MSKEVKIHPSAIVHDSAQLDTGVEIGPFSIIGPEVKLGKNTSVKSHCVIEGHTIIGENNKFFPFCNIGAAPQDNTYKGENTKVVIGDSNTFREYISIHRGTMKENQITTIGSNSLFMAYVHFGHDVVIGNNCTVANSTNFAGHVHVGNRVIIGGGCNISQFVTLGDGAYLGGASGVDRDIPPFCAAYGNRVRLKNINIIGLRRLGYSKQIISEVVDFYRLMEVSPLSPRAFVDEQTVLEEFQGNEVIQNIIDYIKASKVGIAPFMS